MSVICPYCNQETKLVPGSKIYPNRPDLKHLNFWECEPCEAFVGCHAAGSFEKVGKNRVYHTGVEPKGTPAKHALRLMRISVHNALDPFWIGRENRRAARKHAYERLARDLGLTREQCHTGLFDAEMCGRAIIAISKWGLGDAGCSKQD